MTKRPEKQVKKINRGLHAFAVLATISTVPGRHMLTHHAAAENAEWGRQKQGYAADAPHIQRGGKNRRQLCTGK